MKPKSAIQKGKDLENYVAEQLSAHDVDIMAKRQTGSGNGKKKGDIHTSLGWTIECKNTKNFNWKSAAEQVARESMGYQKEVIVWHPPKKPLGDSIAIINLEEFIEFLKFKKDHAQSDDILDKYQIKNNLDRAVYHLKQVVKNL